MNDIFKSPYKNIFIAGLFIFLITAFFSVGYFHADEHFQILEFCNYKLGKSPVSDLPWEFQAKIRPALLPALGYSIIKILNSINIDNPFTYSLIFRIITALLSWFITCKICLLVIKDFSPDKGKFYFIFLSLFLWFIPFTSVRFSSENYSSITFLSAIYFIIRFSDNDSIKNIFQLVYAGLLLGFSFFFRFQIGFAIIGLGLWILVIQKIEWRYLFILLISGFCAIAFCIYLDFWFYGKFELTPINYFFTNIIENKAADYGTHPWWFYFNLFIMKAIPPISIILLVLFCVGLYKKSTNIFTWCIVPFLIGHFAVGHKEIRFLLPMLFCFIYLAATGINYFMIRKFKKIEHFIFVIAVGLNVVLLIFMMITPAQEAINCYKFLYQYAPKKEMVLLCKEKNVYELLNLEVNFYKSPTIKCIVLKDDLEISNYLEKYKPDSILLLERKFTSDNQYEGYDNKTIYCPFPKWIIHVNINNWVSRARIWKIQELRKFNNSRHRELKLSLVPRQPLSALVSLFEPDRNPTCLGFLNWFGVPDWITNY